MKFFLQKCVKQSLVEMGLEKWPDQIQKVIQLNEQLAVRHGVMLVGPSGGGKTTVRMVLQKALTAYYHTMALGDEVITVMYFLSFEAGTQSVLNHSDTRCLCHNFIH